MTIDEAMVEAGARAIERTWCDDEQDYQNSLLDEVIMNNRRIEARAVLEAALAMAVAGERERILNAIADPSDGMLAVLVPEPAHLYPSRGDEYKKLMQSAVAIDRLVMRQNCINIAAAMRATGEA